MPRYLFKCTLCEDEREVDMSLDDFSSTIPCAKCGEISRQKFSPSTFILKGSGWASDGYVTKGSLKE